MYVIELQNEEVIDKKRLWKAVSGKKAVNVSEEQQAYAAIVLNLTNSQLMHVIISKTARDA